MSRSTSAFNVTTHTITAAHLREYPQGTTSGYLNVPRLKLSVNQYVPRANSSQDHKPTDLTIVFGHANGFHRELYEPYFDDLLKKLQAQGLVVRGIWVAEAVHQGWSGVLNEEYLGNDPSWNDYARDITHMINIFGDEMSPPIIGIGHSFGGHAIARAALMHPGLFASIVLLDPVVEEARVISGMSHGKLSAPQASAKRVDQWPSFEDAEKYFRSRGFYKLWDPRVLELHLQFGLRTMPTTTYPNATGITLTTTKHQEVFTFLRLAHELDPISTGRPEPGETRANLHKIKVPLMFIVGEHSPFSSPMLNKRKLEALPSAEMVLLTGTGHLIPQEKPEIVADHTAEFLGRTMIAWREIAEKDANIVRPKVLEEQVLQALAKL